MSYDKLPIRLHAENVEHNVQNVHISFCQCESNLQLHYLLKEFELLKHLQLENKRILEAIRQKLISKV